MSERELPYGPVNVDLFQKAKAAILAEPLKFYMGLWKIEPGERLTLPEGSITPDQAAALGLEHVGDGLYSGNTCGTACCIGGWASAIAAESGEAGSPYNHYRNAALLGMSVATSAKVFYSFEWPEPYRGRFERARTARGRARVAADYIDYVCGLAPAAPRKRSARATGPSRQPRSPSRRRRARR